MRKSSIMFAIAITLFLSTHAALAGPKIDAQARSAEVAPFITDNTSVVVHIDLSGVDLPGIQKWMITQAAQFDPNNKDAESQKVTDNLKKSQAYIDAFKAAGGTHVYLVVSGLDRKKSFLVAPMTKPENANAVVNLIKNGPDNAGNNNNMDAVVVGNAVVAGDKDAVANAQNIVPVARPELADALAAAGDTTFQVFLAPRGKLAQMAQANGAPIDPKSVKWISMGLDLPPNHTLALTLDTINADTAKAIVNMLSGGLATRGQQTLGKDIADSLTPKQDGEKVNLVLTGPQIDALLAKFAELKNSGAQPQDPKADQPADPNQDQPMDQPK